MKRILGLDIGRYSIKAVVLSSSYENYRVEDFFEERLDETLPEDTAISTALDTLFSTHSLSYDMAYAGLSLRHVFTHSLDFMAVRKRDLQNFIESELEGLAPIPLEDTVLDYQILSFSKEKTSVFSVLAKKERLRKLLEALEERQIQVKVIDIETFAYLNMLTFLPSTALADNGSPRKIFIDMGHSKTSVALFEEKKVVFSHVINKAGAYLTLQLQKALQITYKEAENLKHSLGEIATGQQVFSDKKQETAVSVLTECLSHIAHDILLALLSIRAKDERPIDIIFLTGGSACLKGVHSYLEKFLSARVVPLTVNSPVLSFDLPFDPFETRSFLPHPAFATLSQAVALALRGLPVRRAFSQFNLKRGEFSHAETSSQFEHRFGLMVGITSLVLFLFLSSYFFRYWIYSQRIDSMKMQFQKEVATLFGGEPRSLRLISGKADYDFQEYSAAALPLLLKDIQEKKQFVEEQQRNKFPLALRVLNAISKKIPKSVYFEVSLFQVKDLDLVIEADTDKAENVDKIIQELSSIKLLSNVQKKSQEEKVGSQEKLIHFSLTASVAADKSE